MNVIKKLLCDIRLCHAFALNFKAVERRCDHLLARDAGVLHLKVSTSIASSVPALVHIIYVIILDLWLDSNAGTAGSADASNADSRTLLTLVENQ